MAIVTAMDGDDYSEDIHKQDLVMPGFRFHPTEEELIEFYLRRKVEGKRFNIELITFIDLYRYDPWELPAFATIGEKEWFFYVPRDRKYRNGDRPNRVTTSGYWKATGADRTIWGENSKSIGLKKTLVFYSGKAPKGIRTSWIMNEYRLPPSQTNPKVELSLCRVHKRTMVEDRLHHHGRLSTKLSSFCPKEMCQITSSLGTEFVGNSRMDTICKVSQLSAISDWPIEPVHGTPEANKLTEIQGLIPGSRNTDDLSTIISQKPLVSLCSNSTIEDGRTQLQETMAVAAALDELKKILHYNQNCLNQQVGNFLTVPSHNELLSLRTLPNSEQHAVEQDKLWE